MCNGGCDFDKDFDERVGAWHAFCWGWGDADIGEVDDGELAEGDGVFGVCDC